MSSAHSRESGKPALGRRLRGDERINGAIGAPTIGDFHMPSWRNKPPNKQNLLKRRTFEEGRAQSDAAHIATQRLYCDVLKFWRGCRLPGCKRHRRCCDEPTGCLMRGLPYVPLSRRLKAQRDVIAGGPRR